MATPPHNLEQQLSRDPWEQIEQCLWLIGCAVNRLRNADGSGHGRPVPATVTPHQASVSIQAMGLLSEVLLERLR
jgi:hypothetical protein